MELYVLGVYKSILKLQIEKKEKNSSNNCICSWQCFVCWTFSIGNFQLIENLSCGAGFLLEMLKFFDFPDSKNAEFSGNRQRRVVWEFQS